jgi:predicted GNAT superfamily acetyltransferase
MTAPNIRPITDAGGLRAIEDLQRDVWGMRDREVVPVHQLLAAVAAGGTVLGAFDPTGTLLGFCYGLVGMRAGKLFFYSHMAGVRPGFQNQHIGFLLKRAQRQAALDQGLDWMMWTYDPLQSLNAAFNLRKLGATAHRYYVDYYGEMPDEINRGMPSDRLEVDWWLRDPRVDAALTDTPARRSWPPVPPALRGIARGEIVAPEGPTLDLAGPVIRMEIPSAIGKLKSTHPDIALAWRLTSRQAFVHYFHRGYRAIDFVGQEGAATGFYVLERQAREGAAK